MKVKVLKPGDNGFDDAAAKCLPPKHRGDYEPPKPLYVEYDKRGRVIE